MARPDSSRKRATARRPSCRPRWPSKLPRAATCTLIRCRTAAASGCHGRQGSRAAEPGDALHHRVTPAVRGSVDTRSLVTPRHLECTAARVSQDARRVEPQPPAATPSSAWCASYTVACRRGPHRSHSDSRRRRRSFAGYKSIRVSGESMEPTLVDGCSILVNLASRRRRVGHLIRRAHSRWPRRQARRPGAVRRLPVRQRQPQQARLAYAALAARRGRHRRGQVGRKDLRVGAEP